MTLDLEALLWSVLLMIEMQLNGFFRGVVMFSRGKKVF